MYKPCIFIVIGYFAPIAGSESQLTRIALEAKRKGYRPLVFSYQPVIPENQYVRKLNMEGIRVIAPFSWTRGIIWLSTRIILSIGFLLLPIYALYKKLNLLKAWCRLKEALYYTINSPLEVFLGNIIFYTILSWHHIRNRADLLHSHRQDRGTDLAISWAVKHKVPIIFSEHGNLSGPKACHWSSREINKVTQHCVITVLTDKTKQRAERIFGSNAQISVLPNWVEDPLSKQSGVLNRVGDFLIASHSRLCWEKGYDILLSSIKILKQRGLEIKCVISGDGPEREKLQRLANELQISNFFTFLGILDEEYATEYIKQADIFVLPSRTEGMPLSILEAMAAGKPIISTKVGGIPEIVVDGVNGILVEVENPFDLAMAIFQFYNDKNIRESMGRKSREIYLQKYSPEVGWPRLERLYSNIMSQGKNFLPKA